MRLDAGRALVVLSSDDGSVENRLVDLPPGLPAGALQEASNFLTPASAAAPSGAAGRDRGHPRGDDPRTRRPDRRLVDAGLARSVGPSEERQLIVRGQANLLDDLRAAEDLERLRLLFSDLESQKDVIDLLSRAEGGEGVRIFIGSENKLFSLSGSSMIARPFRDGPAEDRRRRRGDRPDPAELRPHRPDGRLHRPGGVAAAGERSRLTGVAGKPHRRPDRRERRPPRSVGHTGDAFRRHPTAEGRGASSPGRSTGEVRSHEDGRVRLPAAGWNRASDASRPPVVPGPARPPVSAPRARRLRDLRRPCSSPRRPGSTGRCRRRDSRSGGRRQQGQSEVLPPDGPLRVEGSARHDRRRSRQLLRLPHRGRRATRRATAPMSAATGSCGAATPMSAASPNGRPGRRPGR